MKLLIFSDIHGDRAALDRLLDIEADHYIAAGDLVSWGRGLDSMGRILERRAGRLFVMPGNHESERDTEALCQRYGFQHLHGRSVELGGWHLAGLGCSNPTPFDTPGEYSEEEIAARLEAFSALAPMVLVCHCPPRDTPLDRVRDGLHFGSTAVAGFLDRVQPRYFFCGHIHEAAGVSAQLGATWAMNVGKKGFLLEL
jgi:Icc-related predicted phosphoesterase